MAKQRQSAVQVAVMHLAKSRAQVKLLVTAAGWRPPLLEPQD